MTQIDKQKFICFDCETTGLDVDHDRIIEVAAMKFDATTPYGEYQTLINPERLIPNESIEIHHITNDMIVGKPCIREILADFLTFIGQSIIIGHSIYYDIDMIARAAAREEIPCTIRNNVYIDTLRMARLYGESPSNSLVQLRKHFNIDEEVAHRAMSDVIVNIELFRRLSKSYGTVEKLLDVLSRPIYLKEMPLGKHKGRPLGVAIGLFALGTANKDFKGLLFHSLRTELKRGKRGIHLRVLLLKIC